MALFKNYKMLHDGVDCGITINGKTIDNFPPEQVGKLINSLPEAIKLMAVSKLHDAILDPELGFEFDEKRRIYGYQPDFTDLKKGLKKVREIPLYVYQKQDKSFKMTASELDIYKAKGKTIRHSIDCPACRKRGIIGTEYCGVCWGKLYISVKSKVVIIPCDWRSYQKMRKNNIKQLPVSDAEIRSGYPPWASIDSIKRKTALSWDDLEDMC